MQDRPQSEHDRIGDIDQCGARIRSTLLKRRQDRLLLYDCLLDIFDNMTEEAKTLLEHELNACYVSPQDIDNIRFELGRCLQSVWKESVRRLLGISE